MKLTILVVENDPRVISILREDFEKEFDAEVVVSRDAEQLAEDLSNDFNLIVCRNRFRIEQDVFESSAELDRLVEERLINAKIIYLGPIEHLREGRAALPEFFRIEDLNKHVVTLMGLTQEELAFFRLPPYVSIPVSNFALMTKSCCDVYIKLKKKSGDQFIKRINRNDELEKETIDKYRDMGLTEFFVKKEDHVRVLSALLEQGLSKIKAIKERGGTDYELASESFEVTAELVDALGVEPTTVRMCEASLDNLKKKVEGRDQLGMMLISILRDKASYTYKRNYLVSLFCAELVPHMGWGRGDQIAINTEKLIFVSFFHDILIREESLLKVHTQEALEDSELPGVYRTQILNHANKVATMVQAYPHAPQGVDVIIRQHHGSSNGVGFPEAYSNNISPMALVFIVVEWYVIEILNELETSKKLNLTNVFDRLYMRFKLVNYKRVVDLLRALWRGGN